MFDPTAFARLGRIGLTQAHLQIWAADIQPEPDGAQPASAAMAALRVIEVQRESLLLHDGLQQWPARMLPALRQRLADYNEALAVGDWVQATRNAHGQWWVHTRLQPLNQLTRRLHDGRDKVERMVIVSNVDTVLLVMGLDHDFNLRRLERYLALVRMARVPAVVVLTKKDLCEQHEARLQQVRQLTAPGLEAVAVDALGTEPNEQLAPWLNAGQTLVLLGSSGAGKSTLTNALCEQAVADTGANRADDSRGRHTTTARSLHLAPGGACIIDTPGLRSLRLDGDAAELEQAFDDIVQLARQCRFRDCRHEAEPGCAVRECVPQARLRNFQKLLREARRDSLTALERKVQVSQWKTRARAARARAEGKRG